VAFTDSTDARVLRAVDDLSRRKLLDPVLVSSAAPADKPRLSKLLFERQKKTAQLNLAARRKIPA
jgi:phosphotransacetylase